MIGRRWQHECRVWLAVAAAVWLAASCPAVLADDAADRPIRVAIYDDTGGGGAGPGNIERCLAGADAFVTQRVTAEQIRAGVLERFDVLVQPGGSGSRQAATLGGEGRQIVRTFVADGGGYLGICAGAYLASADYTWSLGLLDARVVDRQHWARGTGEVQVRLSPAGRQLLGAQEEIVTIYYGQGPLLAPAGNDEIPDYDPLAVYETEIAKKGAPTGVMKGTTAAARGTFGSGRVFCYSPHPEKTEGLDGYIRQAVRWAAGTPEPMVAGQ